MKQHKKYDRLYISKIDGEEFRYVKASHGKLVRIRADTKIGAPAFLREYRLAFSMKINTDGAKSALDDFLLYLLRRARKTARQKNIDMNLRLSDVGEMYLKQQGLCAISGLHMSITDRPTQPSIDRITPHKGYIQSNVRLVCWAVNAGLNNFGTERYLEICRAVAENNPRRKLDNHLGHIDKSGAKNV